MSTYLLGGVYSIHLQSLDGINTSIVGAGLGMKLGGLPIAEKQNPPFI
ncbi:MAG: hypothetical protein RLP02_09275 [Coleofasciculus sp. C2-GNP5-27]